VYLQDGALYTLKLDQVVKGCVPRRRMSQILTIVESQNVSEGHLRVSAEGAANWWRTVDNVTIIVLVDLLQVF
jgi:hypothetical protein